MATAIFFNGRRINIPQAVSKIDASALAAVSPAAVGVIAMIGTAEGGAPLTVQESLADATSPGTIQNRFRSGDLRTAGLFAFEPSSDLAVPGGAQKIINVKVNPSTQGAAILPDDNGVDSLDLSAKDWGLFTNQVNIDIDPGTVIGKKLIIVFEDDVETFDDVGGEAIFDVIYAPGADGYDAVTGAVDATSFTAPATKAELGLVAERTADIPAPGVVDLVSSAAGDTTQSALIVGLDGGGAAVFQSVALSGTVNVQSTQSFDKVIAVVLDAATVGTVTVSDFPVATTLFTLAPATVTRGAVPTTNTPAAGVLTVSIDVDTAVDVVVRGTNPSGTPIAEAFDMTTGATTPVVGVQTFASISSIDLGDVAGGNTITVAVDAVKTLHTEFPTVAKVVDRLNALSGFTANSVVSNATTFQMVAADYHQAPARPAPSLIGAAADFFADLFFIADKITANSSFMNAARSPGAQLPPADTAGAVYLQGGSEGVPTITEWQAAFTLLQERRYNILVPLTRDPAIHSLAVSHLNAKNGRLKSEAQGYIGIGKTDGSGETRSAIQSQIQALNVRHVCAISQEVEKFDPATGVATFFPPYIYAAVAAGMQAGSVVAEPLTRKTMIATNLRNDSSWNVTDDASDLIDRGLMIAEKVDGVGIRWVRSVTTHLADDNLAFVEMSSNESLITAVFELRTTLETQIGKRGLAGTAAAIYGLAQNKLNTLVDEEKIVDFRALQVEQIGDVFPLSVEVALVNPVNFIPITVHLVPTVASAA
jgi:hypothetical protein